MGPVPGPGTLIGFDTAMNMSRIEMLYFIEASLTSKQYIMYLYQYSMNTFLDFKVLDFYCYFMNLNAGFMHFEVHCQFKQPLGPDWPGSYQEEAKRAWLLS
jgi:hypothetical protein